MNDAIAPRSEAPASTDGHRSDSSTGDGDSDTPLIRPGSLGFKGDGSGEGEGKADNKQKRKRTSPKDQATLEAEYKLNPKPNKAARAQIVEKVDLNEKEVQIWFQNRRQIQRRKSRPLLPHEIAAFGIGGMAFLSSDPASAPTFSSSQSVEEPVLSLPEEESANSQETEAMEPNELLEVEERLQAEKPFKVAKDLPDETTNLALSALPTSKREPTSEVLNFGSSSSTISTVFKSFSSTPGYLANRWNATCSSFSSPVSAQVKPFTTPAISNLVHPTSCPGRIGNSESLTPSSKVRLSLSLDGKAELISSELSPPRLASSGSALPQRRVGGLQRSQSAFSLGPLPRVSAALAPRLPRGRSRDARTWQSACDTESRDELTTQAENEASGSAVAAISLLRSTSKAALKQNSNKRNAPSSKYDSSAIEKKPKLGRAQSSLARLQSTGLESKPQSGKSKDGVLIHSPSGDSDKENWVPHEGGGNARRRPLPPGQPETQPRSKPILGDSLNPPARSAGLGGSRNKRRKGGNAAPEIFEDQEGEGEVGEEVEKFMRGEVSPSKRGDFEGAQALLAIMGSGSWR